MIPGGVHERAGEHLHTADILAGLHVVGPVGIINALGSLADVHQVLPGQDGLIQRLRPLVPAGSSPEAGEHRRGGQGEKHGGGGNLCDIEAVGGLVRIADLPGGDVGDQLVCIGGDVVFAAAFGHTIPVGQVQHGDLCHLADVEGNALRRGTAVGEVQAAASGGILAADLRHSQYVPPVGHRTHGGTPGIGLGVELAGVYGKRPAGGDAACVDDHLIPRSGGGAQGLEVTAALLIVLAVHRSAAGIDTLKHYPAAPALEQFFRQLQLVLQCADIKIVIPLAAAQPLAKRGNIRLGDAGPQLRAERRGEERGNVVRQAPGLVVLHEQQLGAADHIISLLLGGYADLDHILQLPKRHDGKTGSSHRAVVGHIGPVVGVTGRISNAGGRIGDQLPAGAVQGIALQPDPHTVRPQPGGIAAVQTGHPDGGGEVHRLSKGADDVLIPVPIKLTAAGGGPVGVEVAVNHIPGVKGRGGGIGGSVVVPGIGQADAGDF